MVICFCLKRTNRSGYYARKFGVHGYVWILVDQIPKRVHFPQQIISPDLSYSWILLRLLGSDKVLVGLYRTTSSVRKLRRVLQ